MAPDPTPRQAWMAVLARASAEELVALMPALPAHTRLRGPEAGLLMLRGRAGGGGQAFNLGEMTVARCTVRLGEDGPVGHAYVRGRDTQQAELAAVLDAALQDPERHDAVARAVIAPLRAAQQAARSNTARKAAATRVEFFTMANMRS
jgi:alpha-D-ribose 1-methylphosphonate 5-triphosphate synthase subunit PhnG